MSRLLYNLAIGTVSAALPLFAGRGSKWRAFVQGRKGLEEQLRNSLSHRKGKLIWIHCPSLGEFEQGRPVLDRLRQVYPGHTILLTFFSPSGFETRKNYPNADAVFYLPWDTPGAVERFVSIANPELVILVKYDFWPNLLLELEHRGVPVIAISSIFRPGQFYFRWYGRFFLRAISTIDRFFLQDENSRRLLGEHGILESEVCGDTRYDRVVAVVRDAAPIPVLEDFAKGRIVWVAGSVWPQDMDVLHNLIINAPDSHRFIIVPHHVDESSLRSVERQCPGGSVRLSALTGGEPPHKVLVVDEIGKLSRIYQYATYAWVGGAYGKGLHNILEAAAYGKPVFFGNKNYRKFHEAVGLIDEGGAFAVSGYAELRKIADRLPPDSDGYQSVCRISSSFVHNRVGATDRIIEWCSKWIGK